MKEKSSFSNSEQEYITAVYSSVAVSSIIVNTTLVLDVTVERSTPKINFPNTRNNQICTETAMKWWPASTEWVLHPRSENMRNKKIESQLPKFGENGEDKGVAMEKIERNISTR